MSYKFTDFDGLEVAPIIEFVDGFNKGVCERATLDGYRHAIELASPHISIRWGVYGHLETGGTEWLADYDDPRIAMREAERLLQKYSSLNIRGIERVVPPEPGDVTHKETGDAIIVRRGVDGSAQSKVTKGIIDTESRHWVESMTVA